MWSKIIITHITNNEIANIGCFSKTSNLKTKTISFFSLANKEMKIRFGNEIDKFIIRCYLRLVAVRQVQNEPNFQAQRIQNLQISPKERQNFMPFRWRSWNSGKQ